MSARNPWKIVLVVEDDSDGRAFRELAGKMGIDVTIDWLPANGLGNIKRKGEKLVALAKDRVERGNGCVAVLVDRDGQDPRRDEPHRAIATICRRSRVPLILVRESFEAWLLADEGASQWLGRRRLGNADTCSNPKSELSAAFYRKTGRTYHRRRARLEVVRHADGSGPDRSPSLRAALKRLDASPCRRTGGA